MSIFDDIGYTPDDMAEIVMNGNSPGVCIRCKEEVLSYVEPDARGYTCPICESPNVYSLVELAMGDYEVQKSPLEIARAMGPKQYREYVEAHGGDPGVKGMSDFEYFTYFENLALSRLGWYDSEEYHRVDMLIELLRNKDPVVREALLECKRNGWHLLLPADSRSSRNFDT